MGKFATAARAARGGNRARKTSRHKLANKRRQRTPKAVRKQLNKAKVSRQEEMNQIAKKSTKRLQELSFDKLTNDKSNTSKQKMSRSERNKFSRQNKRKKKLEEKRKKKEAAYDFADYDRDIESNASSEDEDITNNVPSESDEKEELLQQFESTHKPQSWDVRKSKLSYKSSTGDWVHDKQTTDSNYIDREPDEQSMDENDGDIIINQQEIADYMNLGQNVDGKEAIPDSSDLDDSDDDIDMNAQAIVSKPMSAAELKIRKKQRMMEVKLEIATMGESISQDPYKNVVLLDVMLKLLQDKDVQICQIAMLSLTKSIIDIMPPYKIGTMNQNITVKFC